MCIHITGVKIFEAVRRNRHIHYYIDVEDFNTPILIAENELLMGLKNSRPWWLRW